MGSVLRALAAEAREFVDSLPKHCGFSNGRCQACDEQTYHGDLLAKLTLRLADALVKTLDHAERLSAQIERVEAALAPPPKSGTAVVDESPFAKGHRAGMWGAFTKLRRAFYGPRPFASACAGPGQKGVADGR